MRLLPSVFLAFVVTGCAHSAVPQARRSDVVSAPDGGTQVLLRYAPEDDEIARQVRRALRIALPVSSRWGALPPRVTVTIHPTHEALEVAARRQDLPWLRAWARRDSVEVQSPRSWSRGAATDAQLAQLLTHELTHCALSQALGSVAGRGQGVPFWFWEGMATTNAGEHFPVQPASDGPTILNAALAGPPVAYATADHAFRFLVQRYGPEMIRQLVARIRDGAEFPAAFHEVLGIRLEAFEREFALDAGHERTRG